MVSSAPDSGRILAAWREEVHACMEGRFPELSRIVDLTGGEADIARGLRAVELEVIAAYLEARLESLNLWAELEQAVTDNEEGEA